MEGPRGDLQIPDENSVPAPGSNSPLRIIDLIGSNSSGVIRSDYFAIHHGKKSGVLDLEESGNEAGAKAVMGVEGTDISHGELGGADWKVGEFEEKRDVGTGGDAEREMGSRGIEVSGGKADGFLSSSAATAVLRRKDGGCDELDMGDDAESEVGSQGTGEIAGSEIEPKNFQEFWPDLCIDDPMVFKKESEKIAIEHRQTDDCLLNSGRDLLVAGESGVLKGGSAEGEEGEVSDSAELSKIGSLPVPNVAAGEVKAGNREKQVAMWWKFPSEFLKFCAFGVSPIWSISIAAAVLGIVLLRKRLYRMKRRAQSIRLNVSVDEKKASPVMVRVARLNEAFSAVRRIPIARAPVPMDEGVTTWPMMRLR